jgi:tryptophanyl-tRNA synthetase
MGDSLKNKDIMLSAIQPTSYPHLGNYLGAVKNWVKLQSQYKSYCFIVDLHAITVPQVPENLLSNSLKAAAFNIAAGLDPKDVTLFMQSHVKEHAELAWILNCFTYFGELGRMTQFKDKGSKSGENIGAGLFTYPILMASDILLYDTKVVPVGEDQKQHVELTRNLATRFNNRFEKEIFVVPEPLIQKSGARILDLQDPTSKMSKSAQNEKGVVFMNDTAKDIEKKFKGAVTDSGSEIIYSSEKPGIKNLIDIQIAITGKTAQEIKDFYRDKMYGHLKVDTAKLVIEEAMPIQEKATKLLNDNDTLMDILHDGADRARTHAKVTLERVYDTLGFVPGRRSRP